MDKIGGKITCTCKEVKGDRVYDGACPLHHIPQEEKEYALHDAQGYLLVCLCDCKECSYISLKKLLAVDSKVKIFYKDKKGVKHFVKLSIDN